MKPRDREIVRQAMSILGSRSTPKKAKAARKNAKKRLYRAKRKVTPTLFT